MLRFFNCDDTIELKAMAIGCVFELNGNIMMKVFIDSQDGDMCSVLDFCDSGYYILHIKGSTMVHTKYRLIEWDEDKGKDGLFRLIKPNDTFIYEGSPYIFTCDEYIISLRTGRGYLLRNFLKFHSEDILITIANITIKYGVWK